MTITRTTALSSDGGRPRWIHGPSCSCPSAGPARRHAQRDGSHARLHRYIALPWPSPFLLPLSSTCGIFRRLQLYLACAPSHKRLDGDAPGCGVGYVQSIGPFCLWAPPPARSGILSFYLGKLLDVKCACSSACTFHSVEALLRSGSRPLNEARRGREMWSYPTK